MNRRRGPQARADFLLVPFFMKICLYDAGVSTPGLEFDKWETRSI